MKVINPATQKIIKEVKEDTLASLQLKSQKLQKGFLKWQTTPFSQRKSCIRQFQKLLLENKHKLAKDLCLETGKPITQALYEVQQTTRRIQFFLDHTQEILRPLEVPEAPGRITREPLGVIANISAWNYPYFVGSNVFIPALLTGNTVFYKPSEHSLLSGQNIARLLWKSGIPKEAFQLALGPGRVGQKLLQTPLQGVFFTGSYKTGKAIAQMICPHMIRLQLELGGKDPVYVRADIKNISAAAQSIADGVFYNNGQSCCSVERLYIHQKIYKPFVEAFIQAAKKMIIDNPLSKETYLGPLTRKEQVVVLKKQVKDALQKGAHLAYQAPTPDFYKKNPFFFPPTVLTHVHHKMTVMTEESFGPIIGIQKVKSDEEAIQLMNDTSYGLTAGVFSNSKKRADEILEKINAGTVYWNCSDRVSPFLPWTGRKHSGIGSTLSKIGIEAFLQPKAWHTGPCCF
ncbi:MAG: aldehyde dehydrogenase family protein [Bdellovibrio sp.]|nr:MAG: aldehyde dehydrogenase family protein [Bdellovibrio sp.]